MVLQVFLLVIFAAVYTCAGPLGYVDADDRDPYNFDKNLRQPTPGDPYFTPVSVLDPPKQLFTLAQHRAAAQPTVQPLLRPLDNNEYETEIRGCYVQEVAVWKNENSTSTPDRMIELVTHQTGILEKKKVQGPIETPWKALLKYPQNIEFQPATGHFFSCVDPRATYAIMGTLGGDLGEFVLSLGAIENCEKEVRRNFTIENINFVFQEYLEAMETAPKRFFYHHTDQAAWEKLKADSGAKDPLYPETAAIRNKILSLVVQPDYIGCKHLKAMIANPTGYGVRPEIVTGMIQTFYNVLLDLGNPRRMLLVHAISGGPVSPEAMTAHVHSPHTCGSQAPLLVPNSKKGQVALAHKHVGYFREHLASYHATRNTQLTKGNVLLRKMMEMGDNHLSNFMGVYAKPGYDVVFQKMKLNEKYPGEPLVVDLKTTRNQVAAAAAAGAAAGAASAPPDAAADAAPAA